MTKARDLANASTALSAVSATELAFVDGVTSAIQTQLDAKATLTGTQTLTNKTLTSPVLTTPTISTVNAKGDLLAGTADNTVDRLAVGNDGETLVADSSTSTGLRYTAGTVQANPILNSAFQVWQRGTSIVPTTTAYSADRWQAYRGVAGSTVSRQATGDTTNLPNIQYCARVQRDSGNTSTSNIYLAQSIESINSIPFAGKTITFSYYARKGANYSQANSEIPVSLMGAATTDANVLTSMSGTQIMKVTAALTTTWQRFQGTATVSASYTQLGLYADFVGVGTAGAADYFEITGFQIDIGSVALPFRTYAGTIQGELAACQRYYWQIGTASSAAYEPAGIAGVSPDSSSLLGPIQYPVAMRTTPTVTTSGTWEIKNSGIVITSAAISTTTTLTHALLAWNGSGFSSWRYDNIRNSNSAGAKIMFSSEL